MSNFTLHPMVVDMVDKHHLTPLQGLIIDLLTDPNCEESASVIAARCQEVLGSGSKRHVRRIRQEWGFDISEILLKREMELMGDEFTTGNLPDLTIVNDIGGGKFDIGGGNGADKEAQDMEGEGGFWDVTEELDCVKECSKAPDKAFIFVSAVARKKINLFMKWAGQQEWLAYLVGKWVSENEIEIQDIALPSQSADPTLVCNVNMEEYNKIGVVGVIHSHHEMGGAKGDKAGFSGHDEAFINSNHNVSLLVAKDGMAGHIRAKTPCGAFIRVTATIRNMDEVEVDEKKLQAEFKEKISFGGRGRIGVPGAGHGKNGIPAWEIGRDNYHF